MSLPNTEQLREKLAHIAELRPILGIPYSYAIDGETWTVACDGHALLAIRRDDGHPFPDVLNKAPEFSGVIEPRPTEGWQAADPVALVAWANEAAPDPMKCPHCGGKGTKLANKCETCDGTGVTYCDCPACGDEHDADCQDCHGKPQTDVPCTLCHEPRETKGWLGEALVDRAKVWRWLSWLPADEPLEIVVTAAERPVRFRGRDWFALVMPMRYVNDHPLNVGVFDGWRVLSGVPTPQEQPQ